MIEHEDDRAECCHHGVSFCDPCERCDDEHETLCDQDGHNFGILDGRCSVCGAHAPADAAP